MTSFGQYVGEGFGIAFVTWVTVWGLTIPIRFLMKFIGL